jgi:hypothetical protein
MGLDFCDGWLGIVLECCDLFNISFLIIGGFMPKESMPVIAIKKQIEEQDDLIKRFEFELQVNKLVRSRLQRTLDDLISSKGKKKVKAKATAINSVGSE